jgi:hypothetical protein
LSYSETDKIVLPLMLLASILSAVILGYALRKKSERIRGIPTAAIASFMLFIEVIKQIRNICGEFSSFSLPFHYCSLFVPVYVLAELCGTHLSRIFRPIATFMSFIVGMGLYLFPDGIIGDATKNFGKDFYSTHTFIFHFLLIFYLAFVIALRLSSPTIRDAINNGILGAAYMAYAIPLSYALKTNYNNILESVIPQMESFRLNFGQVPYTILLNVIMTVGIVIASLIYIGIRRLVSFGVEYILSEKLTDTETNG